ncbi:hypothetical protein BJV74DRAFT_799466 [Russula compacta]|nr:hypothetical protein BJV74DRAFT_799466 [Russula compacta]
MPMHACARYGYGEVKQHKSNEARHVLVLDRVEQKNPGWHFLLHQVFSNRIFSGLLEASVEWGMTPQLSEHLNRFLEKSKPVPSLRAMTIIVQLRQGGTQFVPPGGGIHHKWGAKIYRHGRREGKGKMTWKKKVLGLGGRVMRLQESERHILSALSDMVISFPLPNRNCPRHRVKAPVPEIPKKQQSPRGRKVGQIQVSLSLLFGSTNGAHKHRFTFRTRAETTKVAYWREQFWGPSPDLRRPWWWWCWWWYWTRRSSLARSSLALSIVNRLTIRRRPFQTDGGNTILASQDKKGLSSFRITVETSKGGWRRVQEAVVSQLAHTAHSATVVGIKAQEDAGWQWSCRRVLAILVSLLES